MFTNLETYVINLDRSPERMRNMQTRLENLGLCHVRVPAVDGKDYKLTGNEVNALKYARACGKISVPPSEIGCYVSHYNTMKEFLDHSDKNYALVLEDDMLFEDGFMQALESLLEIGTWDVVKFNGTNDVGNIRLEKLSEHYWLGVNYFRLNLSGAYLINRKAAAAYVTKLMPMFVPFDHEFTKFWKYGLRGYSVLPFPTKEDGTPTTISYASNRKPWYKRGSHAFYECCVIIMRSLQAARQQFGCPHHR